MSARYVVALVQSVEGRTEASVSYLSRKGACFDQIRRIEGLREWQPALTRSTQQFTDPDEARTVGLTYADSCEIVAADVALRYEAVIKQHGGWDKLTPTDGQGLA